MAAQAGKAAGMVAAPLARNFTRGGTEVYL